MSELKSCARGLDAWDADGVTYRRKDADATWDDAARVIKRQGKVGYLLDWGEPVIDLVRVPQVENLREAKEQLHRIDEEFRRLAPSFAVNCRSIWRSAAGEWLLLLEAEY